MGYGKIGLAALVGLVAGGCTTVSSQQAAAVAEVAPLTLTPCLVPGTTEMLRCGTYFAPENRDAANGRTLPLKVIVIPARNPAPDMAPILYFQGGPGSPATPGARFMVDQPERDRHDIVLIDQRGTGEGHRLECPGPGDDADMGSWLESVYQPPYPARCRVLLEQSADLRFYTTPIAMQDYDEIRRALGYDEVNLLGGSYGSRAALIYMKMFGEHVRAAMVSGLMPLEARVPLYHPIGAQRALDRVFAECAAEPACHAAFPDPQADLERARARLRAQPVTIELRDPESGAPFRVRLTEQRLLGAIRPMLYSLGMQRRLPLALNRAAAGDYSHFAPAAIYARAANQQIAAGMSLSVICSEDVARITPADVARETERTFFGARFVTERMEACAQWPVGLLPEGHFEPFTRSIPVLLVTGSHDPVTPKWMGDVYARHFPNARHIVVPEAHSQPEGDCLSRLAVQLFATADARGLDAGCVMRLPTPGFALAD